MLRSYKYDRRELVRLFKYFGNVTKDGNYWIPDFISYAFDYQGLNYDTEYLFPRYEFYNKIFFF